MMSPIRGRLKRMSIQEKTPVLMVMDGEAGVMVGVGDTHGCPQPCIRVENLS
jgi:hypothetical protein